MSTILKIVLVVILVALGVGAGYCWYGWSLTQQDLYLSRLELAGTRASLESYQRELSVTREDLATTTTQLKTTQSRLSVVENELQKTRDNLSAAETRLEETEARIASVETGARNLHNPTLTEALEFLKADRTDAKPYILDVYICAHFARDVNNNAESRGIRCAYVDIRYPKLAHAIVAFETVDSGLVYFDAISDEKVRPEIGKEYWRCVEPKPGRQYQKPEYDDTIRDIILIW